MNGQTHKIRILEAILQKGAMTATDFSHISNANQYFVELENMGILSSTWGIRGDARVKLRDIKDRNKAIAYLNQIKKVKRG